MTNFEDIQELARSLIAAATYFTGVSVIADEGLSLNVDETALASDGLSVIVAPITSWSEQQSVQGSAEVLVEVLVRVRMNPTVNAQRETRRKILDAISEIYTALLQYVGDDGEGNPSGADAFRIQSDSGFLVENDVGLREYDLLFEKTANL